jgi:nucleotide-binding universal stress UspA family protein
VTDPSTRPVTARTKLAGPRTILVAVDGTDSSMRALAWAAGLAQRTGAPLTGLQIPRVSVVEMSLASMELAGVATMPTTDMLNVHARSRQHLDKAFTDIRNDGVTVSLEVLRGDPVDEIVRAAQRHRADLLVIGAAASNLGRRNVAARLVRKATCPITIVP